MFRSYFLFTLLAAILLPKEQLKAQYSDTALQDFDKAIMLTHDRLYQKAIPVWEKLQKKHPDHPGIDYYTGMTLFNSQDRKLEAIPYLEDAVDSMSMDHEPFLKERSAPPDVYFYLGRAYHLAYRFDDAIEEYRAFLDTAPQGLKKRFRVDARIERAKRAKKMVKDPVPVVVRNLGKKVNSPYLDHSPVPSSDKNLLFFTSRRLRKDSSNYKVREWGTGKHFEQIYVAQKGANGNWKEPAPLQLFQEYEGAPTAINEALRPGYSKFNHTATSMITSEDDELIVYRSSANKGTLYRSKKKENGANGEGKGKSWGKPEKIEKAINSRSFENHLSVSGNNKHLFFVSTREGGYGGKDLYGMSKLSNGEWSKVYNLGPKVNTAMDEDGPVVHPNRKVLYFSSQGHKSMGGFDIFASRIKDDGTWSKPQNIGYPINTPADDIYFMPSNDGKTGFYSADYKNLKRNVAAVPGYGEEDLHALYFPGQTKKKTTFLKGWVDASDRCRSGGMLEMLALTPKGDTVKQLRLGIGKGHYRFHLPSGKRYELQYLQNGKKLRTTDIKLEERTAYQNLERSLALDTLYLKKNGSGCELKGPRFDPSGSLSKAQQHSRGPIGLYEVTTGGVRIDEEGKKKGCADTVRIVERDTVRLKRKEKGKPIVEKQSPSGRLLYEARFGYNKTIPPRKESDWQTLLDTVVHRLKAGKAVELRLQGSASKVPTSSYPSNLILAGHRAEDLKKALLKALRNRDLPMDKFEVENVEVRVDGPPYKKDPGNKERYAPHQYVKVWILDK
ncbi:MAG: hypothetical protein ABEH38_02730 [Flavobacteriales bacterium]